MTGTVVPSLHILLVEDHQPLAELFALTFKLEGWITTTAYNVPEALAALETARLDVVLTDVMLPGHLSGIDLLNLISSIRPQLPVVVMSANDSPEVKASALAAGASDFLVKPFGLDRLVDRINKVQAGAPPAMA